MEHEGSGHESDAGPRPHLPVSPAERWETPAAHRGRPLRRPWNRGQSGPAPGAGSRGQRGEGRRARRARRVAARAPAALPRGLTHQLMVPNLAPPPGSAAAARSSGITSGFSQSPGSDASPAPSARKRRLRGRGLRFNPAAAAAAGSGERCPGPPPSRDDCLGFSDSACGGGVRIPGRVSAFNTDLSMLLRGPHASLNRVIA